MLRAFLVVLASLITTSAFGQVTFDPLRVCSAITLSNGNLTITANLAGIQNDEYAPLNALIPAQGAKVYYEFVQGPGYSDGTGTGMNMGLYNGYFYPQPTLTSRVGTQSGAPCFDGFLGGGDVGSNNSVGYFASGVVLIGANPGNGFAGRLSATWAPWKTNGTVIGVAVDTVNNKMWARINGGLWDNTSGDNPATNSGGIDITSLTAGVTTLTPVVTIRNSGAGQVTLQAASGSWSNPAPNGFSQLTQIPSSAGPDITRQGIFGDATHALNGTAAFGVQCIFCAGIQINFMQMAGSCANNLFPSFPACLIPGPFCDGMHDDAPALRWLADSIIANFLRLNPNVPVTITFPPNRICSWNSCPRSVTGSDASFPFGGFNNLTMIATNTTMNSAGGCPAWGTAGIDFSGSQGVSSAGGAVEQNATNAITAGDTCATMITSGDERFYPIGRWVLVAGQGLQIDSYPPNYANWEYAQVASTPTGQVCFTAPLAHSYPITGVVDSTSLSTPALTRCSNAYCGGPPRLVRMSPTWGGFAHMIGGTWFWDGEFQFGARTTILDNVTFTSGGQNCFFASLVHIAILNNFNAPSCSMEADKEVDEILMNGGFIDKFIVQSQSVTNITIQNGASAVFQGTPLQTVCTNSTIRAPMFMGGGFGSLSGSFSGNNCTMPWAAGPPSGGAPTCCFQAINGFTIDGITWAYIGGGQVRSVNELHNDGASLPGFTTIGAPLIGIGNVGKNADEQIIMGTSFLDGARHWVFNTTLTSLPIVPTAWQQDPLRVWNCTACTGGPFANEASMAPAQGAPISTYINRTYTCSNNVPNIPNSIPIETGSPGDAPILYGNWTSFTINVTTADTNPADTTPQLFFAIRFLFNANTGVETFSSNTNTIINLATTGTRTITPTAMTPTITGDTYVAPGVNANWVETGPSFGTAGVSNGPAAQCPVFNLTWQTTR